MEAIAEHNLHQIAQAYGSAPAAVRIWSDYDYKRALFHASLENRAKIDRAELDAEIKERRAVNRGSVLNRDQEYWKEFIEDGVLNEEKCLDPKGGNLIPEQLPEIKEAMIELEWIKGEKKKQEREQSPAEP